MINVPNREHPINAVFDKIEMRCPLRPLDVFEPFSGDGMTQIIHYALRPRVNSLTAWDINIQKVAKLKTNFPDTEVKVCDSFDEITKLQGRFDVIIIDNNVLQAPRFEHFDLFPVIFSGLKDESFLVISACGDPGGYYVPREHLVRAAFGSRTPDFVKDWDKARNRFYGLPDVGDFFYESQQGRIMPATIMSVNDMVPVYMDLALKAGYFTKYHSAVGRSRWMKYIILELKHTSPRAEREANLKDKLDKKNATDLNKPSK